MPSSNQQSFGLSGVASTDLGLGTDLSNELQAELKKRKQKAAQTLTNPLSGSASMALLGTAAPGGM
jgi:hypothetical protein